MPADLLTVDQRAEVNFRLGYASFVQKGLCHRQTLLPIQQVQPRRLLLPDQLLPRDDLLLRGETTTKRSASSVSRRTTGSTPPYIPYYLTQIFAAQRRYDELIAYAAPLVNGGGSLRNGKEINALLGQAYFEKGRYAEAAPVAGRIRQKQPTPTTGGTLPTRVYSVTN